MSELEFWKDLGNIFDAVMNYQKKNVEFNNNFINPWIRLGNVFERQDQSNDAVKAYQRAIEIDPNNVQNWINLGDAQFKNGAVDEGIEAYRKAVMLDPEAGWPLGNLALSLVTQGKTEEAIPLYKKSIELLGDVKDKAICWNRLGNAYRKLNDYENAFLAFQKADQLDGENTGFDDKLDETPSNTSVVAPEEILEQMAANQTLEEEEAAVLEAESESAQLEFDLAASNMTQITTDDGRIALAPNMEMIVEETALVHQQIDELQNNEQDSEEETPLSLHEKNFDILKVVEEVIAKVEQEYSEQEVIEEVAAEVELQAVSEETAHEVEAVLEAQEEIALEAEAPIMSEEVSLIAETSAVIEEAAHEVNAILEAQEEIALEVEAPIMSEEVSPIAETSAVIEETIHEVEAVTETQEEIVLEVEAPVMSEEAEQEFKSLVSELPEFNADPEPEIEKVVVSKVNEKAPRHIPTWLIMNVEEKEEATAEIKAHEELVRIESAITLSDISQDVAVNDLAVNMDLVETYTDPLSAQLTTEESLSQEPVHEAADPVVAEVEAQELPVAAESNPVEESSTPVVHKQGIEHAYEEYLKDVIEPANILTDHVDEIQSESPVTKVSKNGDVRIVMDTKNAHVWNELGNIYLNAGSYDDAIASYSKAIELDRQFAWPYSNLALAYVQKERFAEAILFYQRGIELFTSDKDKAVTWNRLGNVYRRINDYSTAIASYQTADELDPENATLSLRSSFGLLGNKFSDAKPAYVG